MNRKKTLNNTAIAWPIPLPIGLDTCFTSAANVFPLVSENSFAFAEKF
jgi:hypothetical protein